MVAKEFLNKRWGLRGVWVMDVHHPRLTGQSDGLAAGPSRAFPAAELGDWFVLHTKSRQEKILADELATLDVAHYLPVRERIRFYGKRKAKVLEPLFPGYVFLRGSVEQAYQADRTRRLASIIRVADQQHLDWELRNLYLALSNNGALELYPYLSKGVRVEVRSGAFRGLQGIIESRTQTNRLILQVEMLGRAVSLEIEGSLLEVIE